MPATIDPTATFPRGTVTTLRRVIAVFAAALILATWRLWMPDGEFPQLPFLACLCSAPAWLDWLALAGMAGGLLLSMVGGDVRPVPRIGFAAFTFCLAVSSVLDQHRLQPWAYQYLIVGTVISVTPTHYGLRLLRVLVVSIYFWSAISKIDAAFLESHGQFLLDGLLRSTSLDPKSWPDTTSRMVAAVFPAGELCVALMLAVPRTRGWGLAASILMHVLLLWTLGPWGLDHKPGVLLWNGYFIAQNVILFRRSSSSVARAAGGRFAAYRAGISTAVVTAAVVLPALESIGWWDHWPSWAVYSSRPAIVTMLVRESRLGDLPPTLRFGVGPAEPLTDWHPVSIDTWSFQRLQCPVYPQERYRLAVIAAVAERAALGEEDVRVRVEGSPNRRTGVRTRLELAGFSKIRARCRTFRLNTRARQVDGCR